MEESSQLSVMDTESQQTLPDSQMSTDQDFQESQSQMETSQSPLDDDVQPKDIATIPEQPQMHSTEDAADTVPTTLQPTEPTDQAVCQNGDGRGQDVIEGGTEKLRVEEEVVEEEENEEKEDRFPDTLEGFKYAFNDDGQLRQIPTGKPFKFDVRKNDMHYNQRHYEALGEVITEYVYKLLESKTHLKKVHIGDAENEPRSFVFMSENAMTTTDKLLILIHGSGVVRAGQWARRLIINECLDSGTQLPYIEKAMEEGYEILVLNTNDNFATLEDGRRVSIKDSSSPREHSLYAWDKFVAETPAEHVAIVAHSYGGVVTVDLAVDRSESFMRKVFAVAFTDSVHSLHYGVSNEVYTWFINNAVNWVTSYKKLGTVIDDRGYDCDRLSAGTTRHEETSWSSFGEIFKFLKNKEEERKRSKEETLDASVAVEPAGETSEGDGEGAGGTGSLEKPGPEEEGALEVETQETAIGGRETEL